MGKFNAKISAEYNPPRKWVLEKALTYTNEDMDEDALVAVGIQCKDSKVTCKKGFVTDLASVPRMCWGFIAPWDVARAAIIHDLLYKRIRQYRKANCNTSDMGSYYVNMAKIHAAKKAADKVFLMAMLDADPPVSKWKIYTAYYAVVLFGRWSIIPREDD